LKGTGFWSAVARLRADRELAELYADRAAAIDRLAFERGVTARVPIGIGIAVLTIGSLAGAAALVVGSKLSGGPQAIVFIGAFGVLLISTHSLAHYVVGRVLGIRFTHAFLGGPPPPRPGVKTDYATYLRTSPRARAVMHASGAVISKLLPFVLVPIALAMDAWPGVVWILMAIGVLTIVTDVLFSTKTSDWMKVRRELRADRRL
jgi:hypothetical protein